MPKSDSAWLTAGPIAHRGLHDIKRGIIENTPGAFQRAIDHGYAIECDLQLSLDGEAMVFHDPTLERLTIAAGPVIEKTADELRAIAFRKGSDRMQTLSEMLDQVAGRVGLVIELKSLRDGSQVLARRAIECLEGYSGNFSLMSFDPRQVATVAHEATDFVRGGVVYEKTQNLWTRPAPDNRQTSVLDALSPDFLSYDINGLPNPFASKFRASGKPLICWTVRDEQTARKACKLCDQITFEGFLP